MKLQRIVCSLAAVLLGVASLSAAALNVTINTYDGNGTITSSTPLSGGSTINLDADSPIGGPLQYGPFNIAKCSGCSGRARLYVSEGSIDKLVITDAQITLTSRSLTPTAKMIIQVDSGGLSVSGPAGNYPYAVELNGSFVGTAATDPNNWIQVKAQTTALSNGECIEGCGGTTTPIDNPALDPGETTDTTLYSVLAPPFSAGGIAVFAPKEQQNIYCNGWFVSDPTTNTSVDSCLPSLGLLITVNLRLGQAARLPGSIGAFHVASRCEPDSTDPKLQQGCDIMANFFASLGPKGFKVYDVRLEPSPGGPSVYFRGPTIPGSSTMALSVPSDSNPWLTKRGADDEGNPNGAGNISNTRARLQTSGVGDLTANGLCRADIGCASSNDLPVRVYCGAEVISEATLHLNSKGDGKVDLIFSLPCNDPAVLIMDPTDQSWVAAPAIL